MVFWVFSYQKSIRLNRTYTVLPPLTCTNTHRQHLKHLMPVLRAGAFLEPATPPRKMVICRGCAWIFPCPSHDWMTIAHMISNSDHAPGFAFWNVLQIIETLKSQILWNYWVSFRSWKAHLQTLSNVTIECSLTHSTGAFGTLQKKMRFQKGRCQGNGFARTFGSIF